MVQAVYVEIKFHVDIVLNNVCEGALEYQAFACKLFNVRVLDQLNNFEPVLCTFDLRGYSGDPS